MNQNTKRAHSSDWMTPFYDSDSDIVVSHKLAENLRAVGGFVSILTGRNDIPVKFNEKDRSYTDGNVVVISANIKDPTDLDVQCGLALHEGSHCLLTDFSLLPSLDNRIPSTLKNKCKSLGLDAVKVFKDLLNYVEDRRIDNFVFTNVPGYRPYYRSLYNHYFHSPSVDVGLLSDEYREETLDSYMFRLINLTNPNTDLDALKELRNISNTLNLKDIDRLKSSKDALQVALSIGELILNTIDPQLQEKENEENKKKAEEQGEDGDGEATDPVELNDEEFDKLLEDIKNGKSGKGGTPIKLTPEQREKLREKFEQQKDFNAGNLHKEELTNEQSEQISSIAETGSEIKSVGTPQGAVANDQRNHRGGSVDGGDGFGSYNGVNCVVVHKMTRKLMESSSFPMTSRYGLNEYAAAAVSEGIAKGTSLGRKLQVRSEERETIYNHQKNGKIDKRRLGGLGYGVEDVFFNREIDMYNTCNLHVSVDASGSMGGKKWHNTMVNVVSLCKAVSMISNLEIQVTFRTTDNSSPYIVQAYDSRVDKFRKVKNLFKYLEPGGTTPEGLCFEAIMDNFLQPTSKMDSFFLNISDGQPYFSARGSHSFYYSGRPAETHTRRMVRHIESMGIKTLSYYVGESDRWSSIGDDKRSFTNMYGKAAHFIDVTSVGQITKTMNRLFLERQ